MGVCKLGVSGGKRAGDPQPGMGMDAGGLCWEIPTPPTATLCPELTPAGELPLHLHVEVLGLWRAQRGQGQPWPVPHSPAEGGTLRSFSSSTGIPARRLMARW